MEKKETVRNMLLELRATLSEKYEAMKPAFLDLEQQIKAVDLLLSRQFQNVFSEDHRLNGQDELSLPSEKSAAETKTADVSVSEIATSEPVAANGNGNRSAKSKKARKGTLRDTARTYFHELPTLYTKDDVAKLVQRHNKALKGKPANENSMFGVMRDLVERKLARVKVASSGTSAQIYEKIV